MGKALGGWCGNGTGDALAVVTNERVGCCRRGVDEVILNVLYVLRTAAGRLADRAWE